MTQDELDAIRKRANAATPGPWKENEFSGSEEIHMIVPVDIGSLYKKGAICDLISSRADLRFIANAREDVPALLDEVERLRAEKKQNETYLLAYYRRVEELQMLRFALEAVEWVQEEDSGQSFCPWCGNNELVGHQSDCQRQAALTFAQP